MIVQFQTWIYNYQQYKSIEFHNLSWQRGLYPISQVKACGTFDIFEYVHDLRYKPFCPVMDMVGTKKMVFLSK